MTPDEIREQVATLPFGPNGKQSVAFLMLSRNLTLDDAVIELERIMSEIDAEKLAAATHRHNRTGVR